MPANLFFGTGIPACVIVLDKEGAEERKHIFMIDASKGFIKDGNKNRLREQDIHKIVDVFTKQTNVPKYSRLVSIEEISDPKNDYNLNIPRYIDSQETEDIQDIEAHLLGGIPNADIDALNEYWEVYPSLKAELFNASKRANYSGLKIEKDLVKPTIFNHPEFTAFSKEMDDVFETWKTKNTQILKSLEKGFKPKQLIHRISEDILATYTGHALMDKYDVYQHLMDYWNNIMQDDCYFLASEGWKAELTITKQTKTVTEWDCDLVPKTLVIDRYFLAEKKAIEQLEAEKETVLAEISELEENLPDGVEEDDYILNEVKNDKGKITKTLVDDKMRDLKIEILKIPDTKSKKEVNKIIKDTFDKAKRTDENAEAFAKLAVLQSYLDLVEKESKVKDKIKKALADLEKKVIARYKTLTVDEIKQLVVDDKWITALERDVKTEMERISQRLTQRIKDLAERYETPLPKQAADVAELEAKVNNHLQKMGFVWK